MKVIGLVFAALALMVPVQLVNAQAVVESEIFVPFLTANAADVTDMTDPDNHARTGTGDAPTFDLCGVTTLDDIPALENNDGYDIWSVKFVTALTTSDAGVSFSVAESFDTQTGLFAAENGYDIYIGWRQVPNRLRWRTGQPVDFDLPADVAKDGDVTVTNLIATLVGCPPSELAALDTGIVDWSDGTERMVLWLIGKKRFLGAYLSTVSSMPPTTMFILEQWARPEPMPRGED